MLGADARVVETGRDGVRLLDLAVLVLHQVAAHAVDDAGHTPPDGRATGRLGAHQAGGRVDEAGEQPRRVGAAADAGHDDVRITAGQGAALLVGLVADHAVQLTHHPRVWVGPITEPRQ